MKKRILTFFLAVLVLTSLLPVGALAGYSTSYYTVTIKAYVYDPSTYGTGYSWGLASFDSNGFDGTTKGDNYNETPWQWAASGSNYTVTAGVNTATDAFMNLKAPQYLWDYDSSEYEFLGWVGNGESNTLTPSRNPDTVSYNYSEQSYGAPSYNSSGGFLVPTKTYTWYYLFKAKQPEPNPAINGFIKERLTQAPEDATLDLDNVTVNYDDPVIIPDGGEVTLLYKLTVTGDKDANFTVTDDGATLVGSNCSAAQSSGKISGTIPASGSALLYVTKTFSADDINEDGKLVNSADIAKGDGTDIGPGVGPAEEETEASEEPTTPVNPSIDGFTKERLTQAPEDATLDLDNVTVNYDDPVIIPDGGEVTLLYKLTVTGDKDANFTVTDDGATLVGSNCSAAQSSGKISGTIPASGSALLYVTKTFSVGDINEDGKLVNMASVAAGQDTGIDPEVGSAEVETPASEEPDEPPQEQYTVTIAPANIVAYTGGAGYGGVTDSDGNIIENTTASGLPEPGYHLLLSESVSEWLSERTDATVNNLGDYLKFTYEDENNTRLWTISYVGVYSRGADGRPTAYVYVLNPSTIQGGDPIPVRLMYLDGENVVEDDNILMSSDQVNKTYTMKINPGALNQSEVKAEITFEDETIVADVVVGTGNLTVLSTVENTDNTNAIVNDSAEVSPDTITAVAPEDVEYYVNDSYVQIIDKDRVQLLVDAVTNSQEYEQQMAQDAMTHVGAAEDAAAELFYLDLVDVKNGNTKVTLGEGNELSIYWPVPQDAAADSTFSIVHYTGMDRTETPGDLDEQSKMIITPTREGDYLVFKVSGFSPFVLIYNADTTGGEDDEEELGEITGFSKQLVTNWGYYDAFDIDSPDFHDGTVYVDENEGVILLYKLTVEGEPGTEYTVVDPGAQVLYGALSGTIGEDGVQVAYVAMPFGWDDILDSDGRLINTAYVEYRDGTRPPDGQAQEEIGVEINDNEPADPPYIPPVKPSEPEYVPDWLNTKDHYAYIIGYEDGSVQPYGSITRAETATIFFRLLTDEARSKYWSSTNSYADVNAGDWYNNAISTLSNMGILGGYADGTFRPNATITRAEFAKIAVSFFKYKDIAAENIFTDVASGSWYESYVAAAAKLGLIEGYEGGVFHPESSITRAEACAIVNRTLSRAPDKDHLLPESEMNVWPDNSREAWYYADMQEATNSHEYKWLGSIEQWLKKLPERDWDALEY